MNLFTPRPTTPSKDQIQCIKQWVDELLKLRAKIPISISQLRCHEAGCPPIETVISVMTQPPRTYKIHRPAAEVDFEAVRVAIKLSES